MLTLVFLFWQKKGSLLIHVSMNLLGIKCVVNDKRGKVIAVVSLEDGRFFRFSFQSPSVFSFKRNTGEILNWHRDNIISIVAQFAITGITVRKIEREAMVNRPSNSDIFKIYMEGVMLSLAGNLGITNRHFYKNDVKAILSDEHIYTKSLSDVLDEYGKKDCMGDILSQEATSILEIVVALISLEKLQA